LTLDVQELVPEIDVASLVAENDPFDHPRIAGP
jgi:hypothetical protein